MIKKKYQCRQCGYKFEISIFESEGEKREWEQRKRHPAEPIRCKKCGSHNVVED